MQTFARQNKWLHLSISGCQKLIDVGLKHSQSVQGKLLLLRLGKDRSCSTHSWGRLSQAPLAGTDAQALSTTALVKTGQLGRSHSIRGLKPLSPL